MTPWTEDVTRVLETTVPLILYIMANKRRAKRENQQRFENLRFENEQRHQENKERLEELLAERDYLQPHDHIEREGNLTADGIIRRHQKQSRKD